MWAFRNKWFALLFVGIVLTRVYFFMSVGEEAKEGIFSISASMEDQDKSLEAQRISDATARAQAKEDKLNRLKEIAQAKEAEFEEE